MGLSPASPAAARLLLTRLRHRLPTPKGCLEAGRLPQVLVSAASTAIVTAPPLSHVRDVFTVSAAPCCTRLGISARVHAMLGAVPDVAIAQASVDVARFLGAGRPLGSLAQEPRTSAEHLSGVRSATCRALAGARRGRRRLVGQAPIGVRLLLHTTSDRCDKRISREGVSGARTVCGTLPTPVRTRCVAAPLRP
jgi:hypothetical protein